MEDDFIIATSWTPDRSEFFAALGVRPNTFAAQLLESVFQSFFVRSIDLRREYSRYFSVEYGSIKDYIELRHDTRLSEKQLEKEHLFLTRGLPTIVNLIYDENVREVVMKCIEKLEVRGESEA